MLDKSIIKAVAGPCGHQLIAASIKKIFFQNKNYEISNVIEHKANATVTALSPIQSKTRFSIMGQSNGVIESYKFKIDPTNNITSYEQNSTLAHSSPIMQIEISPDSSYFVSSSLNKQLKMWNTSTLELIRDIKMPHDHIISSIAISPEGTSIAVGSTNGDITLITASTGDAQMDLYHENTSDSNVISSVAQSHNLIVSGASDGAAYVWDKGTMSVKQKLRYDSGVKEYNESKVGAVNSVSISAGEEFVIVARSNQSVSVQDVESGHKVRKITNFDTVLTSIDVDTCNNSSYDNEDQNHGPNEANHTMSKNNKNNLFKFIIDKCKGKS